MFLFSDQPSGYGEASEKPHSLVHVLLHSFRTHLLLLHRWSHTAPSQSFLMSQKSQQIWGENTETNMFNLRLVMRNQGQSTWTLASLRVVIFRIGILTAMDRIGKLKEIKKLRLSIVLGQPIGEKLGSKVLSWSPQEDWMLAASPSNPTPALLPRDPSTHPRNTCDNFDKYIW